MPKIIKISGPPGTGKTSYLLRQIENACKKYDPSLIGAVSFSKAAVQEMRDRVTAVLGLRGKATDNIRTIHSHCFKLLGLEKSMVAEEKSSIVNEWNEAFPSFSIPGKSDENSEDQPTITQDYILWNNKQRFQRMDILRNRLIPLENWRDEEATALWNRWSKWMEENGYFDFTLMLEEVLKRHLCPKIDVLFVDEAQDLSSLQLAVTRMWAEQCETAIWIGDQDQSLYRFAGAVPEDFRDLPNDWSNILSQSYRVPGAVHKYAMKLINQIGPRREQVDYHSRDHDGAMTDSHFYPDLSLPGSHMVLCRTNKRISTWTKWLTDKGTPWHNPYRPKGGWNPASTKLWKAVSVYDQLSSGYDVLADDLISMIASLKTSGNLIPGIKTSRKKTVESSGIPVFNVFNLSSLGWFEADFFNFNRPLEKIFSLEGHAGNLFLKSGPALTRISPRVIVGTIHSVKGGEADHVWVDRSASPAILRACMGSIVAMDDEIRAAYVAVTRAKESCHLLYGGYPPNRAFLPV